MSKFRRKYAYEFLITSVLWTTMLTLVGWILGATGWFLLALLWKRELFVPDTIRTAGIGVFLLLLWAVVVFLFTLFWARYNYKRYYQQSKRSWKPLKETGEEIDWYEAVLRFPDLNSEQEGYPAHLEVITK